MTELSHNFHISIKTITINIFHYQQSRLQRITSLNNMTVSKNKQIRKLLYSGYTVHMRKLNSKLLNFKT